ncbi:hypothetical protein ACSSS7_000971 [Eimeria intestinalis]
MVRPSDLLQQELESLRQTYSPFAEFAAFEPDPGAPAAAEGAPHKAASLQQQQQQQQQEQHWQLQQRFLCALRHPQGALLLRLSLEQEGLRLLRLDGLPCATPHEALTSAQQRQQQQQQQQQQEQPQRQQQQQLLESWGVHTPQPPATFETFEGLLQAVCPSDFQRMQQELLLRQFQLQQQQQ